MRKRQEARSRKTTTTKRGCDLLATVLTQVSVPTKPTKWTSTLRCECCKVIYSGRVWQLQLSMLIKIHRIRCRCHCMGVERWGQKRLRLLKSYDEWKEFYDATSTGGSRTSRTRLCVLPRGRIGTGNRCAGVDTPAL